MQFDYAYRQSSSIVDDGTQTAMSFSPDTLREPTYFTGDLAEGLEFREAISALHDIVVSDLRWQPKDRTEYLAWAAQQGEIDWLDVDRQRKDVAAEVDRIRQELDELRKRSRKRMGPYHKAQNRYFRYLAQTDMDAWFVLDPVITVHPDEVFFECFSQDESTYGRLSTSYEVYKNVGEFACGTTNIDYSQALYDEFQKVRSYKDTRFEIDPSGFAVQTTNEASFKEVKIDLPDSWVRGFLQVSSAMSLPATTFTLHPMDVHNLCFVLRRNKELKGPRGMRFVLVPGEPIKVVFEPWNLEVVCGRSICDAEAATEVRVWGRRRIHVLERLIPIAKSFTVHLLGTGLPSFYVADLGHMSFTLGLSGWTANDWASAGNFDLMAPRAQVDAMTTKSVFDALKETWLSGPDQLAKKLGFDRATVLGALSTLTQAGRAIYDLNKNVYRLRELAREPLPMDQLRFANDREAKATRLLATGRHSCERNDAADGTTRLSGFVTEGRRRYLVDAVLDADERLIQAECNCNFFRQNRLRKGPCEHILALRMSARTAPSSWTI